LLAVVVAHHLIITLHKMVELAVDHRVKQVMVVQAHNLLVVLVEMLEMLALLVLLVVN
jgi:hypothetical protein